MEEGCLGPEENIVAWVSNTLTEDEKRFGKNMVPRFKNRGPKEDQAKLCHRGYVCSQMWLF